jgi:hypothetical protein
VYGIAGSAGTRGASQSHWTAVLAHYVAAGTIAGGVGGAFLGLAGALLVPPTVGAHSETVFAAVAAVLGLCFVLRPNLAMAQCNVETPKSWTRLGPVPWAWLNGLTLGCGLASRIGFPLWYAIPFGAFLAAEPLPAAAIFALYGFVRTSSAGALIAAAHRVGDFGSVADWVLGQRARATAFTTGFLAVAGLLMIAQQAIT